MIDAHRERPNPIIEVLPQALPGAPKYPKMLILFSHRGPYMKSWSFFLLYLCLHCDEVLLRWHFGTLDSANGHPGPPKHEQKSYFGFLTCRLIWIHYDYWRAPRCHKYKYIYIFHNVIHINMKYQLFIWSFLCMYLPCDEMFLHTKKLWWEIYFRIFLGPWSII